MGESIALTAECPKLPVNCPNDATKATRKTDGCKICVGWGDYPNLIYPFKNNDGSVSIDHAGIEGDVRLEKCEINQTKVKYLNSQPICFQSVACNRSQGGAANSSSKIKITLMCPTSSADVGCSRITWQSCYMDTELEGIRDECFSDAPNSKAVTGCSKNTAGSTKASGTSEARQ